MPDQKRREARKKIEKNQSPFGVNTHSRAFSHAFRTDVVLGRLQNARVDLLASTHLESA